MTCARSAVSTRTSPENAAQMRVFQNRRTGPRSFVALRYLSPLRVGTK